MINNKQKETMTCPTLVLKDLFPGLMDGCMDG
jgi:hypothetical protein